MLVASGGFIETLFDNASRRIKSALKRIGIHEDTPHRLALPKATLKVSLPVRVDDGELQIFAGYRVRYDDTRGPAKDGVRFQLHRNFTMKAIKLCFIPAVLPRKNCPREHPSPSAAT